MTFDGNVCIILKVLYKMEGALYKRILNFFFIMPVFLTLFLVSASPLLAQSPQPQAPPPPVAATPLSAPLEKKGDVSFNFDDADLLSVIQTVFGDILKVNYIIDPRVAGKVTFRTVAPIPRDAVLPFVQVILRLNGIGIVEDTGLYRIVPIADMPKEPAPVIIGRDPEKIRIVGKSILQIVPIRYLPTAEMIRILTPFLTPNALIVDVPKGSYIIISDTDANIKRLLKIVETFDSERVMAAIPKVFVYPVQNGKAKDVASLLQQIFLDTKPTATTAAPARAASPTPTPAAVPTPVPAAATPKIGMEAMVSEGTRIIPDEVTNSIIILATPEDYRIIEETIKKIDIVPRQVVIETLIAEITLKDSLSFGLAWFLQNIRMKVFGESLTGQTGFDPGKVFKTDQDGNIIDLTTIPMPPSSGFSFLAVGDDLRVFLNALATDDKLKVLASPHLLALDNREARIQIGDQVPIVTAVTSPGAGQTATTISSTVQYKDTGIILTIKPQINEGGLVSLDILQEVSDVGKITLGGGLGDQVKITKREVKTNLVVQDGHTIVIGGLIRDRTTLNKSGIPLLSKIPILGYLFGSTTKEDDRTELIVLLTPRVIRNQQEAKTTTSDYIERLKGIGKEMEVLKKEEAVKEQEQPLQGNTSEQ